jgi:hypothetical protein
MSCVRRELIINGGAAVGSTGGFSPFSLAIFAAFTTPPTAQRQVIIDTCVNALVASGVWDKLDVLYMLAAADSQAALVNWVNPGTYDGTLVDTPTFTADEGFTGNGSSDEIDTGFVRNTAPGRKCSQDDTSIFIRSLTVAGDDLYAGRGSNLFLWPSVVTRINDGSGFTPVSAAAGLHLAVRANSSDVLAYRNGAANGSATVASTNDNGDAVRVLGNASQFTQSKLASFGFGAALSAGQAADLYAAELAYMQAVGAVA